ncbi:MAG: tRNA (adenosine(37)-N6)-threonylcarbamoyltransferase complex ATPase subunit type 1 TsaE [Gemmatimonadota bacterium]
MPLFTEAELIAAGERLGAALPRGAVVTLTGDLGAGKTTLVKAIVRGLGATAPASSPTYALVHRYEGRRGPVFHLDCFRLRSEEEAADLDWDGLIAEADVLLVEWPEHAGAWVPPATHAFRLAHVEDEALRLVEGPLP